MKSLFLTINVFHPRIIFGQKHILFIFYIQMNYKNSNIICFLFYMKIKIIKSDHKNYKNKSLIINNQNYIF